MSPLPPVTLEVSISRSGVLLGTQTFGPGTYIIGSGTESDLVLADARVERGHLRLVFSPDERITAESLARTSATLLNGKPFKDGAVVQSEDALTVGPYTLRAKLLQRADESGFFPLKVDLEANSTELLDLPPPAPASASAPEDEDPTEQVVPLWDDGGGPGAAGAVGEAPHRALLERELGLEPRPSGPKRPPRIRRGRRPPVEEPSGLVEADEAGDEGDPTRAIRGRAAAQRTARLPLALAPAPTVFPTASKEAGEVSDRHDVAPPPQLGVLGRALGGGRARIYFELYWGSERRAQVDFRLERKRTLMVNTPEGILDLQDFSLPRGGFPLADRTRRGHFRVFVPPQVEVEVRSRGALFHPQPKSGLDHARGFACIRLRVGQAVRLTEGRTTLFVYVARGPEEADAAEAQGPPRRERLPRSVRGVAVAAGLMLTAGALAAWQLLPRLRHGP